VKCDSFLHQKFHIVVDALVWGIPVDILRPKLTFPPQISLDIKAHLQSLDMGGQTVAHDSD
jgi:hypothetical protein